MIKVIKNDDGVIVYGDIGKEEFRSFLDLLAEAAGLETDTSEDVEEDENLEDLIDEDEDELDTSDGVPHVVSIGYADNYDEVVIMNDYADPWSLSAALLEALAKVWPGEEPIDDKLVATLKELAGEARGRVETDNRD